MTAVFILEIEYVPSRARVPSLATYKVAVARPLNAVFPTSTVGVDNVSTTVRPERVVVTVVVASRARSARTGVELGHVGGESEDASDGGGSKENRREEYHVDA